VDLVGFDGRFDVAGTLIADGAATMNLIGQSIFFSGSVDAPAGTSFRLLANGAARDLVMNTPGNVLSGGGIINGNVALGDLAVLSPGDSPGRLLIDGNLSFGNNDKYNWELGSLNGNPVDGVSAD